MLVLCALILGTLGQGSPKVPTAANLDKLVALYKELHLPVPPVEAVLADRGYRQEKNGLSLIDCGYAVPTKNKHGWYTIYLGVEPDEDPNPAKPVSSDVKNFASLEYEFRNYARFSQADAGLAMAAIEHIRGHKEFALVIYQKWAGKSNHPGYAPSKSGPSDPRHTLAELALSHWYNACIDREFDRATVVSELKNLVKKFPDLDKEESFLRRMHFPGEPVDKEAGPVAETIKRLEMTISNRYKGSNKIEQLIDSLCDGVANGGRLESRGVYFTEHDFDTVQALVKLGHKAIPHLIAHFDDNRLVRSSSNGSRQKFGPRFIDSVCRITAVGAVCSNIVAQFTGNDGHFGGDRFNKLELKQWWAEESKKDEIEACYASLIRPGQSIPEASTRFASAHHPDLLLKALDVILARKDETQIYDLMDAMVQSNLDRKVVTKALVEASKSSVTNQAHAAVLNLKKVSPSDSDEALLRILKDLPKLSSQRAWLSQEAIYGQSVAQSESPEVWKGFLEATRRASLDLRLEMIQYTAYADHTPAARKLYLKYLSAFFDDKAEAPEANQREHFDLPSFRVQYLALILAAYQVKEKPIPKKAASAEEWTAFRKAVEAKLRTEI